MRLRLALTGDLAKKALERLHVVVLECPHVRPTETHTKPDGRVIQLVRDDQTALANKSRNDGRVRGETHGADQRVFHPQEPCNKRLGLFVKIKCPALQPRTASGDTIPLDARFYSVRARPTSLGETEIIV